MTDYGLREGYSAHRLLKDGPKGVDYYAQLQVSDEIKTKLGRARDDIRGTLKDGFCNFTNFLERHAVFEAAALQGDSKAFLPKPRFRWQGSMAYRTDVDPAHKPPQQIDLDDGLFLPTSFIQKGEGHTPAVKSRGLFTLVERILEPFCSIRGWKILQKSTCVRIVLCGESHIDLPLYSIPDKDFHKVVEERALKSDQARTIFDSIILDEQVYQKIEWDKIQLAHREKGWIESDPRKLETWVSDAKGRHGALFRDLTRLIKGWRDHTFLNGGPSSILLMACLDHILNEKGRMLSESRIDQALLAVAQELPNLLSNDVPNPVIPTSKLNDWSPTERRQIVSAASTLENELTRALGGHSTPENVVSTFRSLLGDRVPDDVMLVEEIHRKVTIAPQPKRKPLPAARRTTSG